MSASVYRFVCIQVDAEAAAVKCTATYLLLRKDIFTV